MTILDGAAMQLRFAMEPDGGRAVASAHLGVYGREIRPIIDLLGTVGAANVAHHLVELLQDLIDTDPAGVWSSFAKVVIQAKAGGYQYESLGMEVVVAVVRRYLADYRDVLQGSSEAQRQLMEILDMFVATGWPEARRLAYQLEELFR
jgi:hypothetical protein